MINTVNEKQPLRMINFYVQKNYKNDFWRQKHYKIICQELKDLRYTKQFETYFVKITLTPEVHLKMFAWQKTMFIIRTGTSKLTTSPLDKYSYYGQVQGHHRQQRQTC